MVIAMAIVLTTMMVLLAVSQGWIFPGSSGTNGSSQDITSTAGNYTATFSWTYLYSSHLVWTLNVTIPKASFGEYKDQVRTANYASYVTKNDPVIDQMAQQLKDDSEKGGYDTAQFVLSFVQNIPYGTDENTTGYTDYPRYPVETLVDNVGDCKDHSTLYASLLESPAIKDTAVLFELFPRQGDEGHMAVGIWGNKYSGTYIQYGGMDSFYCETTSPGWLIGEMPTGLSDYYIQVLTV